MALSQLFQSCRGHVSLECQLGRNDPNVLQRMPYRPSRIQHFRSSNHHNRISAGPKKETTPRTKRGTVKAAASLKNEKDEVAELRAAQEQLQNENELLRERIRSLEEELASQSQAAGAESKGKPALVQAAVDRDAPKPESDGPLARRKLLTKAKDIFTASKEKILGNTSGSDIARVQDVSESKAVRKTEGSRPSANKSGEPTASADKKQEATVSTGPELVQAEVNRNAPEAENDVPAIPADGSESKAKPRRRRPAASVKTTGARKASAEKREEPKASADKTEEQTASAAKMEEPRASLDKTEEPKASVDKLEEAKTSGKTTGAPKASAEKTEELAPSAEKTGEPLASADRVEEQTDSADEKEESTRAGERVEEATASAENPPKQILEKRSQKQEANSSKPSRLATIEWPSPSDAVPFWERPVKPVSMGDASGGDKDVPKDPNPMHIVHVTAEMAPLAKVGGLGDVVTGLARACIARGHKVEVLLPFYECIDVKQVANFQPGEEYNSFHRGGWVNLQVFKGLVSGVPVLFFKPANHFFKGTRIYGGSYDELEAYLFFSRAALEYFQVTSQQPDVIHIHEWHTSGVALLYWDMYHSLGLTKPRIALTIHNMEHHGECRQEQLDMCGLNGSSYLTPDKAMDDRTVGHNPERASLLKGGIVYSNVVTTVSPTYAEETLCSGWLASALMRNRGKYHGVLNGIDTVLWDPEKDPHLPATYSAEDLEGKRIVKHYVQRGFGLETGLQLKADSPTLFEVGDTRRPLVVCVTRLVAQKGVHLIRHSIFRTAESGGQFVLLGSAPDPRIQGEFQQLADQFQESKNVRLLLTYSESLAHLLFAAADILLVPSMFEPCGLTQMIAMRYGTIPVVRRTGGLADTVFDVDDQADQERANGYVFEGIGEGDLNSALDRALQYYKEKPQQWDDLASKVMKIDNSWNKSAGQYVDLYSGIRA